MRGNDRFAGSGAGLAAVFLVVACATADRARDPGSPPSAAVAARREISSRIDRSADATRRLDIDALARGVVARPRPDGSVVTFAEARAVVADQLAGIERTISLVVRLDSLRMLSDSAALVYTMQRWERVILANDGTRHRALTQNWLEQQWVVGADGWRGTGYVRETQPGTATLDGLPFVVAAGAGQD